MGSLPLTTESLVYMSSALPALGQAIILNRGVSSGSTNSVAVRRSPGNHVRNVSSVGAGNLARSSAGAIGACILPNGRFDPPLVK